MGEYEKKVTKRRKILYKEVWEENMCVCGGGGVNEEKKEGKKRRKKNQPSQGLNN